MPERNAAANNTKWKQLIDGLEAFAPLASFTTNDVCAALGGDVNVEFVREALNLCATRRWVESTGAGKWRRWTVLSYDTLSGLSEDDIDELDRQRAAARNDQTAKRRSQRAEEKRKASEPPPWKATLQGHLKRLTPFEFEKLSALIVVAEGHTNVIHTRPTGDGGKDIIADYPISSMISVRVLFECKHTTKAPKSNVGKGDYDEFVGVITRDRAAALGAFMATGGFTQSVNDLAAENPAITLQGPEEICDLLKNHQLLVTTRTHTDHTLDADYFALSEAPHPPANPPGEPGALSRALVEALGDLDDKQFMRVAADVLAAEGCDTSHIAHPNNGAEQCAVISGGPLLAPQQFCLRIDTATGELTTQGIEDLRAHFGRHTGHADNGLLITRQRCDNAARDTAARRWPIRILDIDDLSELLIKHHIGTTTSTRQTVLVPDKFADFHAELRRLYDTAHNDKTIQIQDHQPLTRDKKDRERPGANPQAAQQRRTVNHSHCEPSAAAREPKATTPNAAPHPGVATVPGANGEREESGRALQVARRGW